MSRAALASANIALASALLARKAHLPGDAPEDHEDNTFGLPDGSPIRRSLRRFFRQQLQQLVGFVARIGAEIPHQFPRMADYDDPMASAMTPILGVYWDRAGRALRGRLGLDPAEWRVADPNIHRAIQRQALTFCRATNRTTDLGIAEARDAVRDQLARGLLLRGDTIPELTRRIQTVFVRASKSRAETIARSEASRAIHAATEMSAGASGVVSAKRWLLSANSCPVCVALAARAGDVPLGGEFGRVGNNPDYSSVRYPPAHPNCRCSTTFVLMDSAAHPVPAFVPGKPGDRTPGAPEEMAGSGGLAEGPRFVRSPRSARDKDVLVAVDPVRLDEALALDTGGFHVGPGGSGPSAVPGRYAEARRFLGRASAEGLPVHAVEASLGRDGKPYVDDGRHRFAALRDSGAASVPVAVPRRQARRFAKLFGATREQPALAPRRGPRGRVH